MASGKLIIFSAPSGSGKTTIVRYLLQHIPELRFSVSATSRAPRGTEQHGVDYYFLTEQDFKARIKQGDFLEYEQVYKGAFYGTLREEVERIWALDKHVIFDIDVEGGLNLKQQFGADALAVFVKIPNMNELERRLRDRGTDSNEKILERLSKADKEISRADAFDLILVNDDLYKTCQKALEQVRVFLQQ
jgi:guanylate kinase